MPLQNNIKILWISRRPVSRGFRIARHAHSWWQYLFVEDGDVLTMVGGDYRLLSNEQAAIMPGNVIHSFYATTNARIVELKFHARDPWLKRAFQSVHALAGPIGSEIKTTVNHIVNEGIQKDRYYNEMATLSVYQLLLLHLRQSREDVSKGGNDSTETAPKTNVKSKALNLIDDSDQLREGKLKVADIIQYMDEHITDPISLETLAQKFNYTKSYLCQIFSSTVGVPPMRYLSLLRLDRAKELLVNGTLPVQRISVEAGFSSVHQMWRVFRAETDHSPTEFRSLYAHTPSAAIDFTGIDEAQWTQLLSL